ncbi:hypothetical protein ACUHGC_07525 [Testudinibacter sp. P27/CKL/0425]
MDLLIDLGIAVLVVTGIAYCAIGLLVAAYFVRCEIDEMRGK